MHPLEAAQLDAEAASRRAMERRRAYLSGTLDEFLAQEADESWQALEQFCGKPETKQRASRAAVGGYSDGA